MEDLSYQSLDEIRIDVIHDALAVQDSEPDQGGTLLLLRFLIPREAARLPALLSGYAHDRELRHRKEVAWAELPPRVGHDLLPWLASQRRSAQAAGNPTLDSLLADFERVLEAA